MWLVFFLFALSPCFGDFLDLEILPYSRTQCYSTTPYDHIIIYSAPRTGSSLVYNVFRYLFENEKDLALPHDPFQMEGKVHKTHDRKNIKKFQKKKTLCIVPIRDPIAASISKFRTLDTRPQNIQKWCRSQISKQGKYLQKIETLQNSGYHVLILKYEEIVNNFDALFNAIEKELSFSIADVDKEKIRLGYNKTNITKQLASLSSFQEALPLSGFHGNHISFKDYEPPKDLLHWLRVYYSEQKKIFKRYGL